MPGNEHTHPDYEQTFSRVATILDVPAQDQLATERTLREFIAHANERDAETTDKLNVVIEITKQTADKLNTWIEVVKERDADTTDKLNALIDLMGRHLREHGNQNPEPRT
jgi:hypothetical protein